MIAVLCILIGFVGGLCWGYLIWSKP